MQQMKNRCKLTDNCEKCPLYRNGYMCYMKIRGLWIDDYNYYKMMLEQDLDEKTRSYFENRLEETTNKLKDYSETEVNW